MNKSLEALKNRIATLRCNNRIGSRDIANQEILEIAMFLENHIVKDLEAYEKLKQDHDKTLINNGELCVKVTDLQKENQDLKHKLGKVLDSIIHYEYTKERCKREKLEKAIEILKNKRVNIDLLLNSSECPTYNFYAKKQDLEDLTQEEYELLKEVLK